METSPAQLMASYTYTEDQPAFHAVICEIQAYFGCHVTKIIMLDMNSGNQHAPRLPAG